MTPRVEERDEVRLLVAPGALSSKRSSDHLNHQALGARRSRDEHRARVGRVESLGQHLDVDDDVDLALCVALDDRRCVLAAVVHVVDTLEAGLAELVRERLRVERVGREHDGRAVLLAVLQVVLDDQLVAVRAFAEALEHLGPELSVALQVLEILGVHLLLDVDRRLHRLCRWGRKDPGVGELAPAHLVDDRAVEQRAQPTLIGLVHANGRRGEAQEPNP